MQSTNNQRTREDIANSIRVLTDHYKQREFPSNDTYSHQFETTSTLLEPELDPPTARGRL
jgi:hypothetical protein